MGAEGSKRQRLAAAGLSLAVLLALLGVLETGLRLTGHGAPPLPSPFSGEGALGSASSGALPDDELFYRLRPGTQFLDYYRINGLGCRGPDVPARRAAGSLRVVCTGDSSTFGLGVPEERAWPFVLQRLLEATLGDLVSVEVIDAGVPGYTSLQNRVQIERDLLALRPDVLVWMATGHNDGSLVLGRTDAETLAYRRSLRFRLSRWALPHALGVVGDTRTPADADTVHPAHGAPGRGRPRVSAEDFEANLRAVAAACTDAGVPLVLVVPHHSEVIRAQRPDEVAAEEIVLRVARELDLTFADVRPDLDALAPRPLYPDTVHPNADGHAVLGWRVFETLAWGFDFPWSSKRRKFVTAWVDSHRIGLAPASVREPMLADDTPPRFRQALQSLRAGSRDEPADVLAYDPLRGPRRAPYGLGRELLLAAQGDPAAADAETLALLREHVTPADDLTLLLFEPASREPAADAGDADSVALARSIAAFDALLGAHPAPADRRLWQAQRLVATDPAAAIALVEDVLALNPRCAEAFEVRGLALERQGDRSGAQEAFALGAQLEPDSATGSFLLGRTLLQRGETQAAEASLRRALQLDPAHKLARLARCSRCCACTSPTPPSSSCARCSTWAPPTWPTCRRCRRPSRPSAPPRRLRVPEPDWHDASRECLAVLLRCWLPAPRRRPTSCCAAGGSRPWTRAPRGAGAGRARRRAGGGGRGRRRGCAHRAGHAGDRAGGGRACVPRLLRRAPAPAGPRRRPRAARTWWARPARQRSWRAPPQRAARCRRASGCSGAAGTRTTGPRQRLPYARGARRRLPGPPGVLARVDGHALLGQRARRGRWRASTADTPDPEGGRIVRDADGAPDGRARGQRHGLVATKVPPPLSDEQLAAACEAAIAAAARGRAHGGARRGRHAGHRRPYGELRAQDALTCACTSCCAAGRAPGGRAAALRARARPGDGRVAVRAVKV